jgi:EF-P beta-lysylation protein EpmB
MTQIAQLPLLYPTAAPLWRHVQKQNFTKIQELAEFLELSPSQLFEIDLSSPFTLNLPVRLAEKIQKKTLNDPILKQFVPLKKERIINPNYLTDPVQEADCKISQKLLQKYEGRALIVTTSACAMHCRYCFRKNFPYETQEPSFENELKLIQEDDTISEVLLSGGDPLSLSDRTLSTLLYSLAAIPHVKRVRFHTRFPIGIPERIDENLLSILKDFPKQLWFVIHSNHAREFDDDVWQSLKEIQKLGIPVLNQSVLLEGVNNQVDTLQELCEALIDHGVTPYYLHQLDKVQGASHFEVSIDTGKALIEELTKRLPGYGVPRYVQEIPHMPSKTTLL